MILPYMEKVEFGGVQSRGGLIARDELRFFGEVVNHGENRIEPVVVHAPPAVVFFFLFLFLPLFVTFVLTAVAMLYKPGCAVSAADTSSV